MDKIKEINNKYQISLILYTFCFLFAPPIFKDINFVLILTIYSLLVILIKYRKQLFNVVKKKEIITCFLFLTIYILIYILSIVVNILLSNEVYLQNYIINFYSFVLGFPIIFICSLYLIFRVRELNKSFDDLILIFIKAGSIQALIVLITLLFPSIKQFLVNIMYTNTGDHLLNVPWITSRRFFGFANSMLDLFGFGTGLLAVLPLFYSEKHGKKYLLLVPFLLLVPLLNSRSGLIIFAIGIGVWFIKLLKGKDYKFFLKISFGFLTLFAALIVLLFIFSPNTLDWIVSDLGSFIGLGEGTATTLFSKDFWTLPPIGSWLIGKGYSVSAYSEFQVPGIAHSDVGYINEFWKVGILGLVIIYTFIIYLLTKSKQKCKNKSYKFLFIIFLLSIFAFSIKASVFTYNPGCVLIYTLCLYLLTEKKIKEKKQPELDKLISVVVPIYKVEDYLIKCINSIISQTYKKLEIILVDDGSPDKCGKICEYYAVIDARIKVIHKTNGGLSDARNYGMDIATGDYICFIDSDDFIEKDYVEKLLTTALVNESDIVACNFEYIDENNNKWIRKEKENKIYTPEEAIRDIFTIEKNTEVVVWNKLYKRSLFTENDIKFPVGKIHEDNFTTYKLYDKANNVSLINDRLYYYLQRNNSIMSTFNKKRFDILVSLDEINDYFKDENKFESERQCNELLIYLSLLNNMIKTNYNGEEKEDIINKIIENKSIYLKNKYISLQKKIMIIILKTNPKLYSKLFKMLKK